MLIDKTFNLSKFTIELICIYVPSIPFEINLLIPSVKLFKYGGTLDWIKGYSKINIYMKEK